MKHKHFRRKNQEQLELCSFCLACRMKWKFELNENTNERSKKKAAKILSFIHSNRVKWKKVCLWFSERFHRDGTVETVKFIKELADFFFDFLLLLFFLLLIFLWAFFFHLYHLKFYCVQKCEISKSIQGKKTKWNKKIGEKVNVEICQAHETEKIWPFSCECVISKTRKKIRRESLILSIHSTSGQCETAAVPNVKESHTKNRNNAKVNEIKYDFSTIN